MRSAWATFRRAWKISGRVTGAGDIWKPVSETMHGKLPQRMISRKAAAGYSSYGNQIGLATTHVREIFHPGYILGSEELVDLSTWD